jgi:hypothetical protein
LPIYFARGAAIDFAVLAPVVIAIVTPRLPIAVEISLAVADILGARVAVITVAVEAALPKPSEVAPQREDKQD